MNESPEEVGASVVTRLRAIGGVVDYHPWTGRVFTHVPKEQDDAKSRAFLRKHRRVIVIAIDAEVAARAARVKEHLEGLRAARETREQEPRTYEDTMAEILRRRTAAIERTERWWHATKDRAHLVQEDETALTARQRTVQCGGR